MLWYEDVLGTDQFKLQIVFVKYDRTEVSRDIIHIAKNDYYYLFYTLYIWCIALLLTQRYNYRYVIGTSIVSRYYNYLLVLESNSFSLLRKYCSTKFIMNAMSLGLTFPNISRQPRLSSRYWCNRCYIKNNYNIWYVIYFETTILLKALCHKRLRKTFGKLFLFYLYDYKLSL